MNTSCFSARARRWGAALLTALCACAAPAFAATATDPIFTPLLVHTTIEPAVPCADSTVYLAVHLADPCLRVVSFSTNVSPPTLLVRRASRQGDSCAVVPNIDRRYALGRFAAGQHVYTVRVRTEVPNDSGYAVSWQDRPLPFFVSSSCSGARPLPFGLQFMLNGRMFGGVAEPNMCPAVATTLRFSGYVTSSCERYTGYRFIPSVNGTDRDLVLVDFSQRCPDSLTACLASIENFRDSLVLPAAASGARRLEVVVVNHLGCPDSLPRSIASASFAYTVADSCAAPPPPPAPLCTHPYLFPRGDTTTTWPDITVDPCDLRVGPGGTGSIELNTWTGTPLAGLQGVMLPPRGPLHLERIELSGAAIGMHLQTQRRDDGGIAWAIWADHGAPIGTNRLVPVLRVFVRADSVTDRKVEVHMGSSVTAASDSLGRSVALCVDPFDHVYQVWACVGTAMVPASCDANGDGRTNVADLVRMVRCWFRPAECPDTLLARPDCDHDGAFHLDDVLCCARTILGAPRDSAAHAPAHLRFAFGEPRLVGGVLQVPLTMSGGGELGGALLRLEYPGERYESGEWTVAGGVPAGGGEIGTTSWTVVTEHGTDDLLLGLLRLDDAAADEVTTVLQFRLRQGQVHGGTVSIAESELTAPDGAALALDLGGVQAPLAPNPPAAPPARLALSAARPNPSAGRAAFTIALPAAGDVDLAIHDLAGRRVATLWRGALGAGEREFVWNAAGARDGVYFARLVVNGEVRSTRLVLRRDR
ncbi:MAG: T9SS type A sorting domain-containing protein [Candidatus Eisenbacteria bacterium]|uniref:T9SS type A sorting domain-containing protein n=1 Tax=Eiseniibacteriota bacterium TaxID=2212470 RepID=A0A933S9T4_UNCEI|nr:T9SS type A sorting domain-containing protein [Candidatus Eisenbacteria bacterium]